MNSCSGVPSVCVGWKCVGVYVRLPSANVTSFAIAPVPAGTSGDDVGSCGDVWVLFTLLCAGFKFLSLFFNHTMRMMMTIVTTNSTASNDTTPATIPADDPLVVLPPDFLSVVEKHLTSAQ